MPGPHSQRVVGSLSEAICLEWRIPDFFKLEADEDQSFHSPVFPFSGCTWCLELYPKGYKASHCLSLLLWRQDSDDVDKTVICAVGVKKSDGMQLEECGSTRMTFKKKHGIVCRYFLNLEKLQQRKSELAPSDTLTITCRMEDNVTNEHRKELVPGPSRLTDLEPLSNNFNDLFVNKKKCDVTIQVKGKDFQTHKAVLVARSPVFAAMFEHDTLEELTGVVTVQDCDPDSFGDFLQFLYTGKLEDPSFRNARHLYVTADKYDVQKLKSFCATYMQRNLTTENVFDVVILADHYVDSGLLSSAQDFFNESFHKILSTNQWESTVKNNFRLANKLLMNIPIHRLIQK